MVNRERGDDPLVLQTPVNRLVTCPFRQSELDWIRSSCFRSGTKRSRWTAACWRAALMLATDAAE